MENHLIKSFTTVTKTMGMMVIFLVTVIKLKGLQGVNNGKANYRVK